MPPAFLRAGGGSGRRVEAVGPRHVPHALVELALDLAGKQFARLEEVVQLREQADLGVGDASHQVLGFELRGMFQARRGGISARPLRVLRWKLRTRSALSGTTSARWRSGSWVATPVGHLLVWQLCDWMQPMANMKPRAELAQSAPVARTLAISKALTILPLAPTLILSRRLRPTRVLWTNSRPSRSGTPIWSVNSSARRAGAASPSTTMKSGGCRSPAWPWRCP